MAGLILLVGRREEVLREVAVRAGSKEGADCVRSDASEVT
jgi:hypothetical protein